MRDPDQSPGDEGADDFARIRRLGGACLRAEAARGRGTGRGVDNRRPESDSVPACANWWSVRRRRCTAAGGEEEDPAGQAEPVRSDRRLRCGRVDSVGPVRVEPVGQPLTTWMGISCF